MDGGGFAYRDDRGLHVIQQVGTALYDVTELAEIPTLIAENADGNAFAERAYNNGREVFALTPEQMDMRAQVRRDERRERAGIDYELGVGVPWGNAVHRKAARRASLVTRSQRRIKRGK